ncbi:MAG: response regulator transcription factor [Cellulomonas sp.]
MKILVVDDNALIRLGLRASLAGLPGVEEVREAANGQEALDVVGAFDVDIALLDVRMPVLDGIGALPGLLERCKVVMLTNTDDVDVVADAMTLGASGYIIHGSLPPEGILAALQACLLGGTFTAGLAPWGSPGEPSRGPSEPSVLSVRESEVMALAATGLANPEIAKKLFLSEKTVKNHINSIFSKLAVTSRGQAMALWHQGHRGPVGPL